MKKQMKMMISIMIAVVMIVASIPLAYADGETNFSVMLTAPNTVKRGETVEVTVELDAFTGTGKGINSFMADLEYDETKLSITSSQIVAQNQWDAPMYENNKLLTAKGSMVTAKEAIMKMTFTVNAEAEFGETTITIKNAEAANDENDFIGGDGTITIEIIEEITPPPADDGGDDDGQNPPPPVDDGGDDDGQNPPPPSDDGGDDDGQNPPPLVDDGNDDEQTPPPPVDDGKDDGQKPSTDDKKEESKDNTIANKEYDKAGTGTIIFLATAVAVVLAIIIYRKNKKYQDII